MKKEKTNEKVSRPRKLKPASTPEARENQLISLAVDLAEQQLMDGTASSQVITHFLKQGSMKEKYEREKLQSENELLKAKVEALQSIQSMEQLYSDAIKYMSLYRGESHDQEESY